jgi:hypothetical protein
MWYIKHKQTEANEGGTIWVIRDTLWTWIWSMEYGVWSDGRWSSAAGAGVWCVVVVVAGGSGKWQWQWLVTADGSNRGYKGAYWRLPVVH